MLGVGAGITTRRRRGAAMPAWAQSDAAADFDFAGARYAIGSEKTFAEAFSFSRASAGVAQRLDGSWESFASGVARITDRGILIEEARTNRIRNNTMAGAVVGNPGTLPTYWGFPATGGLTPVVTGVGVQDGIFYIDIRITGTSTVTAYRAVFEPNNITPASVGQTWTHSMFGVVLENPGGLLPSSIQTELREFVNGVAGTGLSGSVWSTNDGPFRNIRHSHTRVLTDADTTHVQPTFRLGLVNGGVYDFTLRIGMPQLEGGAFTTSPIPTTNGAMTRAADVCEIAGTDFSAWYNQNAGTFYTESTVPQTNASGFWRVLSGNVSNTPQIFNNGGVFNWNYSSIGTSTLAAPVANSLTKIAGTYAVNDVRGAMNGTLGDADTSVSIISPTAVKLGAAYSTESRELNGYISRLTYFPSRLSNAILQRLTT